METKQFYRTMKCSLKSIVLNDLDQIKLSGAVMRTHRIVIHAYQMLRLWILKKYNDKDETTFDY